MLNSGLQFLNGFFGLDWTQVWGFRDSTDVVECYIGGHLGTEWFQQYSGWIL